MKKVSVTLLAVCCGFKGAYWHNLDVFNIF